MIQIKNAAELEKMRKACAISAAALKAGGEAIEPGITTAEIDKIIYDFIVRHGARPNFLHLYGFPATACISVNDTVIHGIPSRQQQIRPGDIVSIDTGCKIDGFNGSVIGFDGVPDVHGSSFLCEVTSNIRNIRRQRHHALV